MLGVVNLQQNNIIKIFSVAAVVLMPPTLVASIYGMNFKHMPELEWIGGYPFALLVMLLAAALPYLYFKWRKWLSARPREALTPSTYGIRARAASHVLAAIDVDLGAVHVGTRVSAQHVDDLGDLVGSAEPLHWDLLNDLFRAGTTNRRVDLAGRNGVDADAQYARSRSPFRV